MDRAMRATRGEVRIQGEPSSFGDESWRHRVGILSHRGFLYARMTAEENLRFYGKLFGLTHLDRRIPERLERVGVSHRR